MNLIPKNTGSFLSYDGTRIYYEVRGEGEPIIMNYGIGCLINHWQPQIKHFSKTHKTIVYDYRAHHSSDIPEQKDQLTLDALAQDLNALMEHLGLEQASIWGHSFGAQVLMRAYDMFPHRFKNMVFINGFVSNPIQGMFGNDLSSSFFHLFKSGYQMLPETLSYLWRFAVNNPIAIHLSALAGGFNLKLTSLKDIEIYVRGLTTMDLDSFLSLFEGMMNYDGRAVLDRVQVPTLIIAGKNDSVTPLKHQEEMHLRIKNSEFLVVPYGSHCTQLDMPELVNLRIEKFLHPR